MEIEELRKRIGNLERSVGQVESSIACAWEQARDRKDPKRTMALLGDAKSHLRDIWVEIRARTAKQ